MVLVVSFRQIWREHGRGFAYSAPRNCEEHRCQVLRCKDAINDTEGSKYQSKYGVRCSELVGLPYIDFIRMICHEPMHNLFLGTGKLTTGKFKGTLKLTIGTDIEHVFRKEY